MKCKLCGDKVRAYGRNKNGGYDYEITDNFESMLILECDNADCDYFVKIIPEFDIKDMGDVMGQIHKLISGKL
jgi:hypothetical protein